MKKYILSTFYLTILFLQPVASTEIVGNCSNSGIEYTELGNGGYCNIHYLLNQTLLLEYLENPRHNITEYILVDNDYIECENSDFEMHLGSGSLGYSIEIEDVPMTDLRYGGGGIEDNEVDFEYRGKIIIFGDEYYVNDIEKLNDSITMYLASGKVLDGLSNQGYTAEYLGYKFKINRLLYCGEYCISGIVLDVEKPDGEVVQAYLSETENGRVDDIEIRPIYAEEYGSLASASIQVYDMTTQIILEEGENPDIEGQELIDWMVSFVIENVTMSEVDDYEDANEGQILKEISITYVSNTTLQLGESVDLPNDFASFKFYWDAFCDTEGDLYPCNGTVSDFEIMRCIDFWTRDIVSDFNLLDAIDNWAGVG